MVCVTRFFLFFLFPLNLLLDYALLTFWNIDHHAWDIIVTHENIWCHVTIKAWVSECTVERQNSFLMSVCSENWVCLFPMFYFIKNLALLILIISPNQYRLGYHANGFSSTITWFVLCREIWRALRKLKQMQSSNLLSLQRHGSQFKVCRLAFHHDYRSWTFHLSHLFIIYACTSKLFAI